MNKFYEMGKYPGNKEAEQAMGSWVGNGQSAPSSVLLRPEQLKQPSSVITSMELERNLCPQEPLQLRGHPSSATPGLLPHIHCLPPCHAATKDKRTKTAPKLTPESRAQCLSYRPVNWNLPTNFSWKLIILRV